MLGSFVVIHGLEIVRGPALVVGYVVLLLVLRCRPSKAELLSLAAAFLVAGQNFSSDPNVLTMVLVAALEEAKPGDRILFANYGNGADAFVLQVTDQIEKIMEAVGAVAQKYDFNEHGGAPLLGVNGIWIICHGASSSDGIKNAIRECKKVSAHKVNQHITELLSAGS